eukprot:898469_1
MPATDSSELYSRGDTSGILSPITSKALDDPLDDSSDDPLGDPLDDSSYNTLGDPLDDPLGDPSDDSIEYSIDGSSEGPSDDPIDDLSDGSSDGPSDVPALVIIRTISPFITATISTFGGGLFSSNSFAFSSRCVKCSFRDSQNARTSLISSPEWSRRTSRNSKYRKIVYKIDKMTDDCIHEETCEIANEIMISSRSDRGAFVDVGVDTCSKYGPCDQRDC